MTRQNVQIFLVAVVLIGVAGVAAAQFEELARTIPMEPGGRFTLGNVSGEITVTGVDGDDRTIRGDEAGRRPRQRRRRRVGPRRDRHRGACNRLHRDPPRSIDIR